MATEQNLAVPRRFVTTLLPWLVGTGGLLVYLFTLNRWVPLNGLWMVSRVSGWAWQPALSQPLTWAVLYPFRWLPQGWIPLALNLFTAICAGLVLVLLARSVALLPHDVTRDKPFPLASEVSILSTPTAWIPPVLAAMVCGLELSFWVHATAVTGAMIDLLLFAYILRCLLEYRIDQDEAWVSRCALVYGAGMANDWALIGYLPVFIAALVRITGFGVIYNRRLLRRTVVWGLAGLSLYLLLPALHSFSSQESVGFWAALKANLKLQKDAVGFLRGPRFRTLALASLLPMLVLSIRWKSHTVQFGDDTRLGVFLIKITVPFLHALFFVTALWIGLDPTFSPRHLGLGTPMLTYYYLSAIVAGYCAGYFLLMGSSAMEAERARAIKPPRGPGTSYSEVAELHLGRLAAATVWVVLLFLPMALLWRNVGPIRITNGPAVREFARELCADLPPGRSVVLSEDSRQLLLLRAELGARNYGKEALPLETPSLASTQYQRFMAKQFPSRWPVALPTNEVVQPLEMIRLIAAFAAQGEVVYAHPSSGLFFESFVGRPNGLIYRLVPRGAKDTLRQTLEPEAAGANEQIWQQRWTSRLASLAEQAREKRHYGPSWAWPLLATLRLTGEQNWTVSALGAVYSKSLNDWGVQVQRLGRWAEAGVWFDRALALNPNNLTAQINAKYNQQCQRGDKQRLQAKAVEKEFDDLFATYRNWADILGANGPLDEPTFLLAAAQVLRPGANYRQAAGDFARCGELAPDWVEPKLWLALSYIDLGDFARALELTQRVQTAGPPQHAAGLAQLLMYRMTALQRLGRTNEAAACVESFIGQHREQADVLSTAADLLEENEQFKMELAILEEVLSHEPNDLKLLARKGHCEVLLAQYEAAVTSLNRVLSRDQANTGARLYRAGAFLGTGQLEAARDDYRELLKAGYYEQNARFGLATIALHQRDTNAAIKLFREYLSNSVPGSREFRAATDRLNWLKGG
jgi:tetratricopeptide (TPR) repeat protein